LKLINYTDGEGQIDTSTPDGWLRFAMKAFLGEMERRQIRYRTTKAMEYKKTQGAVVGAVPYGYKRNGNGLEISDAEQRVIQFVNHLYHESLTLSKICEVLREEGIKTSNGNYFTHQQVKRFIAGYENTFSRSDSKMSRHLRQFIIAIA
jgi:DNA invertase Pin-like site-specific DNA recombinase